MKIIADKNIPFLKGVVEDFGETEYIAGTEFSNERIKDAEVLIVRTVAKLDRQMLENTSVKLICTATIGFDHIDTKYCEDNGIVWKNAPGCNSSSVQQYITSVLILLSQKKGFDLANKTIGIVGVGNVGKKVAKACEILGMRVLQNDPVREAIEGPDGFVSIETIKSESDIITFHTPLTHEGEFSTYHMANSAFFDSLEKKPVIINSARGSIIDTHAIKKAIRTQQISGAVIDCWENEPEIDLEYMEMVDIATPHIAGYSADGKANATRMSLETIARFYDLDRSPIDNINPLAPSESIIDLNKFEQSDRLYSALLATYNPMTDYEALKSAPYTFKKLRNEYPLRREYLAYTVMDATEDERRFLNKFDFRLG